MVLLTPREFVLVGRRRRLSTRASPTSSAATEWAGEPTIAEAAQQAGISSAGLSA